MLLTYFARNLIAWCCKHFDTVLIHLNLFYTFKTTFSVRVSVIKHQLKVWNAHHYKVINLSSFLKETWFSCYYASLPAFHWLNSAMWAHSDGCIYGKQHSPVSSTESAYVTQQWLRCTPWCVHNNNPAIHPPPDGFVQHNPFRGRPLVSATIFMRINKLSAAGAQRLGGHLPSKPKCTALTSIYIIITGFLCCVCAVCV